MGKEAIKRGTLGALIGISISVIIGLIISASIGDGAYHAFVPALASDFGSEFNAVLMQTLLSAVLGFMWGSVSVFWDIESWSLSKATFVHFIISAPVSVAIAYILHWTYERSLIGIIVYLGIFALIYAVIWLISYSIIKRQIKAANSRLKQ